MTLSSGNGTILIESGNEVGLRGDNKVFIEDVYSRVLLDENGLCLESNTDVKIKTNDNAGKIKLLSGSDILLESLGYGSIDMYADSNVNISTDVGDVVVASGGAMTLESGGNTLLSAGNEAVVLYGPTGKEMMVNSISSSASSIFIAGRSGDGTLLSDTPAGTVLTGSSSLTLTSGGKTLLKSFLETVRLYGPTGNVLTEASPSAVSYKNYAGGSLLDSSSGYVRLYGPTGNVLTEASSSAVSYRGYNGGSLLESGSWGVSLRNYDGEDLLNSAADSMALYGYMGQEMLSNDSWGVSLVSDAEMSLLSMDDIRIDVSSSTNKKLLLKSRGAQMSLGPNDKVHVEYGDELYIRHLLPGGGYSYTLEASSDYVGLSGPDGVTMMESYVSGTGRTGYINILNRSGNATLLSDAPSGTTLTGSSKLKLRSGGKTLLDSSSDYVRLYGPTGNVLTEASSSDYVRLYGPTGYVLTEASSSAVSYRGYNGGSLLENGSWGVSLSSGAHLGIYSGEELAIRSTNNMQIDINPMSNKPLLLKSRDAQMSLGPDDKVYVDHSNELHIRRRMSGDLYSYVLFSNSDYIQFSYPTGELLFSADSFGEVELISKGAFYLRQGSSEVLKVTSSGTALTAPWSGVAEAFYAVSGGYLKKVSVTDLKKLLGLT
ncbi:MAG: hypothetical protein LBH80_06950, partial [Prevotellaceae bacterium]|jgi:hypothetical protein|nr:hypothetical protein [Prevotellaceae bacterium]